ncbi:MAG: ABC transporter permease subunit [Dehalococcoidia bacterium]|nr:ABC transporter permease subunit [Dehalococcoidia bacterium]MCB9484727.1 ABC transporter permease subunit [Thermoflexaceae bacterium]
MRTTLGHWFPPAMRALIRKEFREYRHHRAILLTGLGLPLVFMMLPFLNLVGFDPDAPPDKVNLAVGQSMFVFFLTPAIVPAALAAYSIIGEKEQGTLEAILTLPLTDRQFLHAKIFAVAAPAVVASSLVYLGFTALSALVVKEPLRSEVLDPIWSVGVLGLGVPLALFSTLTGLSISARARDLRVAEQLAGMVILPALAPVALVAFRVVPVNLATWATFFAVVMLVDLLLLAVAYRTFERERAIALAA